jgi:ABC-type transport system involved in multi-copper enzyme maturation permease subunit
LFAGPIIAREALTAPRPLRFYVARATFVGLLFVLMWTAWQVLIGFREVREFGIIARFGGLLFQIFVLVQLTLMLFFAPLAAATAVAHEKDRRTFVLLLMTDLSDTEIVLGKLMASLLQIGTLLATATPVFFLCMLLGGVSPGQILDVQGVTAAAGLAGGALGLLVALWRDRTFQSLALTVLLMVLALAGVETLGIAFTGTRLLGVPLATALNPYRAVFEVMDPAHGSLGELTRPSMIFIALSLALTVLLLIFGVYKLRVWNPGRNEPREQREGEGEAESIETLIEVDEADVPTLVGVAAAEEGQAGFASARTDPLPRRERPDSEPAGSTTGLHVPRRTHRRSTPAVRPYRRPWKNPIVWRELMTRAYGTKPLIIKGAYVLAFALGVAFFYLNPEVATDPWGGIQALIPPLLAVLSLVLVNAQGVTALTSERDSGALDLLLVTELTPGEFIYGKLGGILYNTKEMVVLPVCLALWFAATGVFSAETALFAIVDFLLLSVFSAMLGLHAAITYTNSRTAVANSLGTIFFLLAGIFFCAYLIILSDREFGRQLLSFLIFIGAGSVALFGSLGAKNPSRAIALVSILTPFWSFYCIISLWRGDVLAAFLFSAGIYGFALLAMLVPAVSDFDIALGRTNAIQG